MNIWKSYMWTMEWRIIWRTIIAVIYATYACFLFATIHNSNTILIRKMKKTRSTDLTSPPNDRWSPELTWDLESLPAWSYHFFEDPARGGGGGSHVAHLNFKTSRIGVYKCLLLIVGFAVTVAIWLREVVSCRDFILRALATFWAMSLVRIYPGRASWLVQAGSEPTSSSSIDRGSPN